MARVTVEDCLEFVDNRFTLVHLASKRAKQIFKGSKPLVDCKNRESVIALREIADGKVKSAAPLDTEPTEKVERKGRKSRKSH